jgi:hypothetical protein
MKADTAGSGCPITVALLTTDADPLPAQKVGDPIVVVIATLVSYPDRPGPALPGLIQIQWAAGMTSADWSSLKRALSGKEPQVRLHGAILPTERPGPDGPVPHVVKRGDELHFNRRTTQFHEGNWPPIRLPVEYKGQRCEHIYSRITAPERPFVDVVGTIKAGADGSLRVQAGSILGKLAVLQAV